MPGTTIVIPCYNEAPRLAIESFAEFSRAHTDLHFLFVNDGSSDDTLEVLRGLEQRDTTRFTVLDLKTNRGKAEAVRRGLLVALAQDRAYVGFWDADLATPLETIPEFVQLLEDRPDLEMVFGSRVKLLGRSIQRSAARHYLGRVFATIASLTLGLPVYDTQCGAKLFRVSPSTASLFQEPFIVKWTFDVEIIARLIRSRRENDLPGAEDVIYEFPLSRWHDVAGSNVKPMDFPKAILETLRIRRRYLS